MTTDERDARLTAYALDDPGLTPAERDEIMQRVVADPAARRAVEETRAVAELLTAGLAAELAAQPVAPVTVPSTLAPKRRRWVGTVTVAVAMLLAVGGGVALMQPPQGREVTFQAVGSAIKPPAGQGPRGSAGVRSEAQDGGRSATSALAQERELRAQTGQGPARSGGAPAPGGAASANGKQKTYEELKPGDRSKAETERAAASPQPTQDQAAEAARSPSPQQKPEPALVPGGVKAVVPGTALTDATLGAGPGGAPPEGKPAGRPPFAAGGAGADPRQPGSGFGGGPGGPGGAGFGGGQGGFGGARQASAADPRRPGAPLPGSEGGAERAVRGFKDAYDGRYHAGASLTAPGGDRFPALVENDFVPVAGQAALSTFGVDVDTASYAIVRNHLVNGQLPPPDAVRLEEIVNYFPYQDKGPEGDDPFAVTVEMAACPWQPSNRLARIGLKAKTIAADKRPPSNLVFLVDVSGSMAAPNRLPLVKASLKLLVGQLGENDRVAMVVYAGVSDVSLDSTSAVNKGRILEAIDKLEASGSTNGGDGLQRAYALAAANFVKGGTNRVILCTDGDWNVGLTGTDDLVRYVEQKRATGVFLSVFGFGMGNLRDEMLVKLAGKGNGNYGYVDTIKEAHKALVEQLSGTLVTVAKDVKIQVEFNPAAIKAYRLLGYEKRLLAAQDFHDDKKDAGEMGAGHVVTALYELVPAGEVAAPAAVDPLRYQPDPTAAVAPAVKADKVHEAFVVKMRHKKPDGDTSTLRELPVSNVAKPYQQASDDFRFAASAASFAMLLRNSPHKGTGTFAAAADLAGGATKFDPSGYRAEFAELVRKAQQLSGRP